MTELNAEQLAFFKTHLEQLKASLESPDELAEDSSKPVELDQSMVGRLSRMDAMQGQAMALEVKRRKTKDLKRVNAALMKIAEGEFGLCEACDELINPARLNVDPAASLCIRCAEQKEADG